MTERVYLENPYLRQLDARIIEKEYINDKYYIKLNKTIFYPNLAGGQPGDKGNINGVDVLDTYEEDSQIVHVIGENIHSDKVTLTIDWNNRLDYMQQHSGQHLLSSVFYKLFNAETTDFYIGKEHLYIDVNIPYLTNTGVEKIEKFTSKIIFSNFPIKSYIIEKDEIEKDILIENKLNNSSIRIVEIDGIDFTPCCGTHLRSTGEIGLIKIKGFDKIKNGIRVEFVCGSRALDDYRIKNNCISSISTRLNCDKDNILDTIDRHISSKELLIEENNRLKHIISKIKANEIKENSEIYKDINFLNHNFKDIPLEDTALILKEILTEKNYIVFLSTTIDNKNEYLFGISHNLSSDLKDSMSGVTDQLIESDTIIYEGIDTEDNLDNIMKGYFNRIIKVL